MKCIFCNQEMTLKDDFAEDGKIVRCDKCEFEALLKDDKMVKYSRYGHIRKETEDDLQ